MQRSILYYHFEYSSNNKIETSEDSHEVVIQPNFTGAEQSVLRIGIVMIKFHCALFLLWHPLKYFIFTTYITKTTRYSSS